MSDFPFPTPEPPESVAAGRRVLRSLSPVQRLRLALQLSERTRLLFRAGLRHRHPDLDEAAFQRLSLERLEECRRRADW